MTSPLKTPGVYLTEESTISGSVIELRTAVPVFIGYTERADKHGKCLLFAPTKISSLEAYEEIFGGAFHAKFTIMVAPEGNLEKTFQLHNKEMLVKINENNRFYLYNSIRLFYANGGADAYILSIGAYGDKTKFSYNLEDFIKEGDPNKKTDIFSSLEKEQEPTLILAPDLLAQPEIAYKFYRKVLAHCQKTRNRMGIFDLGHSTEQALADTISKFRDAIGIESLSYGAAYYPWVQTTIVESSEIDFTNLDDSIDLHTLLPEEGAKQTVKKMAPRFKDELKITDSALHYALLGSSESYNQIMAAIRENLNLLPAGAAIAGVYNLVDSARGVWRAPANISLFSVISPAIPISNQEQEELNVDPLTGKSINVIKEFPELGTLVWGARTLDGNSQDWRYINVRRTMMMTEQALRLYLRLFVFEPNDANTWTTVKKNLENYLFNLFQQGALAGETPDLAYTVEVGLGSTMTPTDILDGIIRVTVKVAISRPGEFIEISIQQQQQQSS